MKIVSAPLTSNGTGAGLASFTCTRSTAITGVSLAGQITTHAANTLAFNRGALQKSPTSGYTNYHPYSYAVGSWTNRTNLVSGSLVADPAGTTLGYPFIASTAAESSHVAYHTVTGLTASTVYCFSAFVRAGTPITGQSAVWCRLNIRQFDGSTSVSTYFNITAGTVGTTTTTYSGVDPTTYRDSSGNAWRRIWFAHSSGTGSTDPRISVYVAEADNDAAVTGDGVTPSFWVYGAQVNAGAFPLPLAITNGSAVAVGGEAISADISTNTTLTNVLGNGTAVGTVVCEWKPGFDPGINGTSATPGGVVTCKDAAVTSLLYQSSGPVTGRLTSYDNTASVNTVVGWVQDKSYKLAVRWSETTSLYQISYSADNGATWTHGTATAFDGSFSIGTALHIGYANEYPFTIKNLRFFNEWVADAALTKVFRNSTGSRKPSIGMSI